MCVCVCVCVCDCYVTLLQAIWLESGNPKLYFIRAELREKVSRLKAFIAHT